jgi:hypothetical protein
MSNVARTYHVGHQHLDPAYARGNWVSEMLDMIERLAPGLMREGGGSLQRSIPHSGERIAEAVRGRMRRMAEDGQSLLKIAEATGYSYSTVCRETYETRRRLRKAG